VPSPGNQLHNRLTFESSITPDHPYYKHIVYKNPLFHFIITADEFGYIPFTMTRSAELCSLTRQEFRTRLKGYEEMGVMTIKTNKTMSQSGKHKINVSKMFLNLSHDLFKKPEQEKQVSKSKDGYPPEFEQDWKIYRGKDPSRVGDKIPAFTNWMKSVNKYGRSVVMKGTINYVAKCESMNIYKKHGATWWNPTEARFMGDEYQKASSSDVALWKFLNSPVLGNILKGGAKIKIVGDKYMGETILRLRGTDRFLGESLDRMGDRRFREEFTKCYDEAKSLPATRDVIYSQFEQEITWDVNADDTPGSYRRGETST